MISISVILYVDFKETVVLVIGVFLNPVVIRKVHEI